MTLSSSTNCTTNGIPRNPFTLPSYEIDKIYVILAVATATLSFFLNLFQFVIILHQGLLKRNKNIVIINLCICGQLSSFTVFWYIYKVTVYWREENVVDSYLFCFLLPSGLHLLTIFTFTPLITLLVLQHHLVVRPRSHGQLQKSHLVVTLFVILAWCEAIIVSIAPLTGWNDWKQTCSLPQVWSPSFSVLVCVLYFLHYPIVLILLTDLCLWSAKRRKSVSPESSEDLPNVEFGKPNEIGEVPSLGLKSVVVLFVLFVSGTLPFVFYTARVSMNQEGDLCQSLVANEKVAMWTSWMIVLFAAIRPMFHVIVDDDLGDGTTNFLASLCRWQGKSLP